MGAVVGTVVLFPKQYLCHFQSSNNIFQVAIFQTYASAVFRYALIGCLILLWKAAVTQPGVRNYSRASACPKPRSFGAQYQFGKRFQQTNPEVNLS